MSLLNKTISFVAVLSALPAAYALTARPSVVGNAASRMPTMTASIHNVASGTVATTTTTTTSSSSLMENTECIDAYTACLKAGDVCGADFEECTTRVLFHAQMPKCLSTLIQCNSTGINSLFGVGNTTALQTIATKNAAGEVTDYTYPTDGSILGQMIIGAAIANKYDTSTCVKRYTACLKKDSVCGNDFELCTTDKEFKKQRVFCDSTLARCQSEGVIQLFGSNSLTANPTATSRVGELIAEGAALAAVNAVSTCYKVVDQCILNACSANPYRCNADVSKTLAQLVDSINNGTVSTEELTVSDLISKSDVAGYIKSSCLDTIGANKYCYATFLGNGTMPTASQLKDEDNQEEIYDEAYAARMNSAMRAKIADLIDKFDTKAKQNCTETIRACAMRTCGSGSGAACYYQVFGSSEKSINGKNTYSEIKTGCDAVVNTDPYCKYAAANPNASGPYSYSYINTSAFDTLFPEYDATSKSDPIGVVASLNATLANSYNDAALAQMRKQCQTLATSCVKSVCGAEYAGCYRNRTDVHSDLTNTGNAAFDKSMNKVGGVLDYTIVLGSCLDTIKNSDVCAEHLAIETSKITIGAKDKFGNAYTSSWGDKTTVRDGWIDAGGATQISVMNDGIQAVDANGNKLCTNDAGDQGVCNTMTDTGDAFDEPVMISQATYKQNAAVSTLFRELVYDLEKEAQAKYNMKLTKEQNACLAANQGGILGKSDTGSAYMWVKLKSNKVPANYSVNGLKANAFTASNDLYGSFCRARVTLQSDDKRIQDVLRDGASWSTAYFAVGDTFTCGSWIPSSELEKIAEEVGKKAIEGKAKAYNRTKGWLTALGVVGGTGGGMALASNIVDGKALSGLTGVQKKTTDKNYLEKCESYAKNVSTTSSIDSAKRYARQAIEFAKKTDNGAVSSSVDRLKEAIGSASDQQAFDSIKDQLKAVCSGKENCGCSLVYYATIQNGFSNIKAAAEADKGKSKQTQEIKGLCSEVISTVDLYDSNAVSSQNLQAIKDAASDLQIACSVAKDTTNNGGSKGKTWTTIGGGLVGGVAGGFLINKMVGDIQQGMLDSAKQAAYDEFMNEVGRHITCYIGSEEAGTYGDVLAVTVE